LFSVSDGLIDGVHPAVPQVDFIEGNAQELPLGSFPATPYDLHTIAFGIWIVTSIPDVPRGVPGAQT
jgi:ubiquinone/menaquinone biosynthesis C-methylase UbiE